MAELKPLPGYVLIEPVDDQETTASGLVMPDKAKEKPGKGKILAVGLVNEDTKKHLSEFKNTDLEDKTVIFHRWAGQDVKEGQKEYRLVKYTDLMGIYG